MNKTTSFAFHRLASVSFTIIIFFLLFMIGQAIATPAVAKGNSAAEIHAQPATRVMDRTDLKPVPNARNSTTLFFDDFSGDLSQWTPISGIWYISNQTLFGDAQVGGIATIYAGDFAWTDYVVQTQVVTQTLGTVVIVRSAVTWQTEYRVELWWEGSPDYPNHYNVYKLLDGNYVELPGGIGTSKVPITASSLLRVQVTGSHLAVFIDDQFVVNIVDPDPIPAGRFALGVNWGLATFDDVIVTTPPPIVLYPAEQTEYGKTDSMITYTLELANYTGQADSFNLAVLPGSVFSTTLSTGQLGPIVNGGKAFFNAYVHVPVSAQPDDTSLATIQASPVTSPTITATSKLITIAYTDQPAYVLTTNKLFLVDRMLYSPFYSINLTQYGCSMPDKVVLTPDTSKLYVGCFQNKLILIFNTSNNSYLTAINLPESFSDGDIAFTRDGAYAVVGGAQINNLYVVDTASFSVVKTISGFYTRSLTTHPYLPYIYIASLDYSTGNVGVLNTNTFTIQKSIRFGSTPIWDVQSSPDGQWVYATGGTTIFKLDPLTNQIVDQLTEPDNTFWISITPDDSKIFVSSHESRVFVIDGSSFSNLTTFYVTHGLTDLKFTCNGSELWVANSNNEVTIVDPDDYSTPHVVTLPDTGPSSIALCSPVSSGVFTHMAADHIQVSPTEEVSFTLSIFNYSTENLTDAQLTDILPITLNYVEGSLHATSGSAVIQDGVISWTGALTASMSVDIIYSARVTQPIAFGTQITNSAEFSMGSQNSTRSVTLNVVPWKVLIPCALRACAPFYSDDFSNPNSGWPIVDDEQAVMGYQDGEYQIYVKQSGWIIFAQKDIGVTTYKVEVDTRAATHTSGSTGIIFDISDAGFYQFEVSDGWYSLWRLYNNQWDQLIFWQPESGLHPGNASNHLAVVRKGGYIYLYINGVLITRAYDDTLHSSKVGMFSSSYAENFAGNFDNFAVSKGVCIGDYFPPVSQVTLPSVQNFLFGELQSPISPLFPFNK